MLRFKFKLVCVLLLSLLMTSLLSARVEPRIQVFEGAIEQGERRIYTVDIQLGETLYAFAANQSGDFDPVLLVLRLEPSGDHTEIAYNDDGGGGLNAALDVQIMQTGIYEVVLYSTGETAGEYQLAIGINAPQLLEGDLTVETQANIASFMGATSEDENRIQMFEERITPEGAHYYAIPELFEGQTLYVRVDNLAGNYDPYMQLFSPEGEILYEADDDTGLDIRFDGLIPADGSYELVISEPSGMTFGSYRLIIGVNSPGALLDDAIQTEEFIAVLDKVRSRTGVAIEEVQGEIEAAADDVYTLEASNPGDILYLYVESLTDGFIPQLDLTNFAGKIVTTSERSEADDNSSTLTFEFPESSTGYQFFVYSADETVGGAYRVLAGVNTPEILEGTATPDGAKVIRDPYQIESAIHIEQISAVNQLGEYFEVVATFRARWTDPRQAFDPSDCLCSVRSFTGTGFDAYFESAADIANNVLEWPGFIFVNQQGERQVHYHILDIHSDGFIYFEEQFTGQFRADFDFTKLPFDTQKFDIRVTSPFIADYMQFIPREDGEFTGFGQDLGEEEWIILGSNTRTFIEDDGSVYSLEFSLKRHLTYYIYRLFIPLLLIVFLGWAIFLIDDHDARIAASSGNLLIFIAFNFTIADDLPRLSYLTFMDGLLIVCFVISSLAFVISVYLRWLDNREKDDLMNFIDRLTVWLYPASFVISLIVLILTFLR